MKSILPRAIIFSLTFFYIALQISTAQVSYTNSFSELPGGDVLRPEGGKSPWFIGIDGGITYSSFSGGPVLLGPLKNPHRLTATRKAFVDEGNGLGFYIGGAVDFPLSKSVGIVGKLNYHTRSGNFSSTTREITPPSILPPYPADTMDFAQDTKWTFNYIGIDLLLRVQLIDKSLYLIGGFGFANLSKNNVKLDERMLTPNHYYFEDSQAPNYLINKITTLSSETEIVNLNKNRFDFKIGAGTWIPISDKLFLTPEVMFALPITKFSNDFEYKMMTLFATIGLRWQM